MQLSTSRQDFINHIHTHTGQQMWGVGTLIQNMLETFSDLVKESGDVCAPVNDTIDYCSECRGMPLFVSWSQ